MADHVIAADEVAAWGKSLVAAAVDTVTFARPERAAGRANGAAVRVHLDSGTTPVYFTVDGSTPAVPPAAGSGRCHRVRGTAGDFTEVPLTGVGGVVKLTSAGAVTYSVEATL